MTFQELATALDIQKKAVQQSFFRHKLSIHRSEDIQKFLSAHFSEKKSHRSPRPWQTAKHLQKWRFVKKVRRMQISPLAKKLKILEEKLARKEAENSEFKIRYDESTIQNLERITRLEDENSAITAQLKTAKEKLIAAEEKLKTQKTRGEQKPLFQPVEKTEPEKKEIPTKPTVAESESRKIKPETDFGVVPPAEERRAAAQARKNAKIKMENEKPIEKIEIKNTEPVKVSETDFGVVPPAEERRAAAQARKNAKIKTENEKPIEKNPVEIKPAKEPKTIEKIEIKNTEPVKTPETQEIKSETSAKNLETVEKVEPPKIKKAAEIATLRAEIREKISELILVENSATEEVFTKIPTEEPRKEQKPLPQPVEKVEVKSSAPENLTVEKPETVAKVQPVEIPETQEIKSETKLESEKLKVESGNAIEPIEEIKSEVAEETPVEKIEPKVAEEAPTEKIPVGKVEVRNSAPENLTVEKPETVAEVQPVETPETQEIKSETKLESEKLKVESGNAIEPIEEIKSEVAEETPIEKIEPEVAEETPTEKIPAEKVEVKSSAPNALN